MENIPEFKKPESEEERIDREVRGKIKKMIDEAFVPKHEPRTQEEIQKNWDEYKKKQEGNNLN